MPMPMPRPRQLTRRQQTLATAAGRGALAGVAGVLAMTAGEKVEQRITRRKNSYVPGRALLVIAGQEPPDSATPTVANHALHWATGALLGSLRGVWAATGIRGAPATATHAVVRLAFDQTVENTTGAGAPPSTWPTQERVLDLALKSLYAVATGLVADRWIAPAAETRRGAHSH
ncbi:MAG: hypothetical protein JWR90_2147 [Marmoricola sp.]|jgi:hypothetical protein|nr:hypothetical protein [Marmoricola sp.]